MVEVLKKEISKLEEEIEKIDRDSEEAKSIREKQADAYSEADDDYTSTIDAITDAIKLLEKSKKNTESALLAQQKVQAVLPFLEKEAEAEQKIQLAAFLQAQLMEEPDESRKVNAKGDYEKHIDKYAFKS